MEENTYGSNGTASGTSKNTSETTSRSGRPSVHEETVYGYMEQVLKSQGRIATFNETVQATHLPESTVSRLRNSWLQQPRTPVKPPEVFHVKPEPVPEAKVVSSVSRETKGGHMKAFEVWNQIRFKLGLIGAIVGWSLSILYSFKGFRAETNQDTTSIILALALSALITILELLLNGQSFSPKVVDVSLVILWIGGILAYAYGIWTNIIGLSIQVLGTSDLSSVSTSALIIPILAGALIEVLPEPMLVIYFRSMENKQAVQQQKNKIPVPPPNTIKQANTVSPYMDPAMLAKLQQTHPYRPANKQ